MATIFVGFDGDEYLQFPFDDSVTNQVSRLTKEQRKDTILEDVYFSSDLTQNNLQKLSNIEKKLLLL